MELLTYNDSDTYSEFDVGCYCFDDQIEDLAVDQFFNAELNHEVKHENRIVDEFEEFYRLDNDKKDFINSVIYDSSNLDIDQQSSINYLISLKSTSVVGRGRFKTKAIDEYNQELPVSRISDFDSEKDFYPKLPRITKLPSAYSRKREDQTIQICTNFKKENY
ncbi:unnamed protein product [Rotaria sordida]|uniref:Uncharacterized protein n=1 Tax=Rotaria sordida TaxID=392033 RepID=A0A818TDP8_9BILA|nr:unnamed protein product [Rotaria sordida]CAF1274093.1 unnamed protein product [Rotaria sordida]CAF1427686.1 unnamed protein product [Rotaria sordida]CAF1631714.1 unnamed protein product [Rotaria sordida]CAF3685740.1 unnamed protein product [Rotaria sordida]